MRHPVHTLVALALTMSLAPRQAPAQTTSRGATPTEARPDFSGTWTLDRSISNDPSKATFEPAKARSPQRYGGFSGGSHRGGGGGSRSPSDDRAADDRTPDERTRLQALTDQLRKASDTLVISHHDPSFVINDAQDHTQFFQTDDSTNEHQVGAAAISSTTHWEGSRLITEYALSSRLKLVFTFTLLAASKQMVIRVRVDDTERRRVASQELKLAYTLAPSAPR
jgi:hypothetical protein